ncbi:endonuclease/exonuclease/phosphatase family protein [Gemmobacter denitrificans]|uniref:Endonuclease/exonuclease/phosphatase family protein n=1 Tax=Gemmobacter denitrificans TaxID=3123040 RepID=A0ABU8BT79_9RHOB
MLEDILQGDAQVDAAVQVIVALDADVLLLTGVDFDMAAAALMALADRLAANGAGYPYRLAAPPNAGMPTGFDLDRNGKLGEARDAMGYGRFHGQGGMALLSRLPLGDLVDHSGFPWADLPAADLPPDMTGLERLGLRLSSTGHWQVPVLMPEGGAITVLAWSATPPVFDGPEDRNGRRNHDETAFWLRLLDGALPAPAPEPPFILMGEAGLDPQDGEGRPGALRALLGDPRLQDPAPRGEHGRVEPTHKGDPALDTAFYPKGPGGLRVDYVLPSADLRVTEAGVLWPAATDPLIAALQSASRHYPVWVDIALPAP